MRKIVSLLIAGLFAGLSLVAQANDEVLANCTKQASESGLTGKDKEIAIKVCVEDNRDAGGGGDG